MARSNSYRQQLNHQSQQEWIFMIHLSNKCFHSAAFHESEKFPYLYHTLSFVSFSKTISKKTPSLLQLWFPQSFEFVVCWPVRNGFPQLVGAPDHQWCNSLIGQLGMCSVLGYVGHHHQGRHPPITWAKGQNLGHSGHHHPSSVLAKWASPWV